MSNKPINLFTLHSRQWQHNKYVYPVISRRSNGLSVGVNLNPDKACNFDCVYCSVDRKTMPGKTIVDMDILKSELQHMIALVQTGELWQASPFDRTPEHLKRLNDIAFSGDGEPTSFQRFHEACELVAGLLQQNNLPDVKIVVITNATLFHQSQVKKALQFLESHNGELWAKLDAGTQAYYETVERTVIPLQRVLDNILTEGKKYPLVIQSLFMRLHDIPPDVTEIDAYIDRLHELKSAGCQIKLVQIYTTARDTAESFVTPLHHAEVDTITEKVRAIGIPAAPYYGPS